MNNNTHLHRQVHPSWVQNEVVSIQAFTEEPRSLAVSSLAFTPSLKDEKKLSLYNGDVFTAEESHKHFTKDSRYESCGVLSVTKGECDKIGQLMVEEDNVPFDGHCSIDFSQVTSKGQIKDKGRKLRDEAVKRNWTFRKNQ
ncbi:hypothetical protein ACS5NO_12630 [Larkinella sp. GY13]|uniref:hypothetical protein n=1 Tax=Larkinella sp. GY13 TaxID=3453720 RepID=UPI003EE901EE